MLLLQPLLVYSISEEPYCYAASDFMVAKYQDYPPQLIALYDNTDLFFDVNNDGVWEYKTRINKNKPYYPKTSWDLQSGSYIHSNKPIIYNQKIYALGTAPKNSVNYQCVPPINSLQNEILLLSAWSNAAPYWRIISPNATINIITPINTIQTENIHLSKDINSYISRPTPSQIWYINSTKPIIASSIYSLNGKLDNDFIKVIPGKTIILALEDNTLVEFDQNGDGIFDESNMTNKGRSEFILTAGSRIRSDKKISVFENDWHVELEYSTAIPTKSMNNEIIITIHEANKEYITGIFNSDDGFENTTYNITEETLKISGGVPSNDYQQIPNDFITTARVIASKPITGYYKNSYITSWYRIQRPMQTIEPYISSFSRLKFVGLNDTAIINVRVFNPTSYDLDDVKINIRYLDVFPTKEIKYYQSIKSLEDDSFIVTETEKSVTPTSFSNIKEFTINLGTIKSEEYANIEYYLITPAKEGTYNFPKASLEFNAPIWTIN